MWLVMKIESTSWQMHNKKNEKKKGKKEAAIIIIDHATIPAGPLAVAVTVFFLLLWNPKNEKKNEGKRQKAFFF